MQALRGFLTGGGCFRARLIICPRRCGSPRPASSVARGLGVVAVLLRSLILRNEVIADSLGGVVQPLWIFAAFFHVDRREILRRIGFWFTEWCEQPLLHNDGNVRRLEAEHG